jgi:hypothetical protein
MIVLFIVNADRTADLTSLILLLAGNYKEINVEC